MHTEDEAKKLWCPMVRIAPGNEHWQRLTNREEPLTEQYAGCRCIASACMAWRWRYEPDLTNEGRERIAKNEPIGMVRVKRERGYCGLAGAPTP